MKKQILSKFKINYHDKTNLLVGTIDKNNPKSLFFIISSWITINNYNQDDNYNKIINDLNKKIKQYIHDIINQNKFENRYIVELDMRESGFSSNKPTYMSCEVTLYQKGNMSIRNKDMVLEVTKMASYITDEILIKNKNFNYFKKKMKIIGRLLFFYIFIIK